MPALPLDEAGKYVAGAYIVFLALLLIYVAIMAARLARIDRELGELAELAEDPQRKAARASDEVAVTPPTSQPPGNAPTPAGNVAAGEASGGVIHEASGGVIHEASGGVAP